MEIVIIGGGASGLMCAYECSQNKNNHVIILEKNEKIGKKMYITGKGRCNVTNLVAPEEFLNNVVTNKKFLYSAINNFSPYDTVKFFEDNGLKLKVERGNRVFPTSDKSSDVIKVFSKVLKGKVEVRLNSNVQFIKRLEDNKFMVCLENSKIICDKLVLATGGKTYSSTGSTGDGYKFASLFSHHIVDLKPSLVAIKLKDDVSSLSGLTLKNVKASVKIEGKTFSAFGELLFTHFGVSGPIILTLSSYINSYEIQNLKLFIDLKPALTSVQIDERLQREFKENNAKNIKNYLKNLLPSAIIPIFMKKLGIFSNMRVCDIDKNLRKKIVDNLKNLELTIDDFYDFDSAIVTSGGVDTREINPKTMESKLVKNLFIIGELVDVDALTGGFNLQIAFSTGYLAGKYLREEN